MNERKKPIGQVPSKPATRKRRADEPERIDAMARMIGRNLIRNRKAD